MFLCVHLGSGMSIISIKLRNTIKLSSTVSILFVIKYAHSPDLHLILLDINIFLEYALMLHLMLYTIRYIQFFFNDKMWEATPAFDGFV